MNDEQILILGKGYIGTYVNLNLIFNNVEIVSSKELNYHDPATLEKYILNNGITTVINCSGFTGRPNIDEAESKKELCWFLNVTSPLQVARICKKRKVKYIHINSGCIYTGYDKEFTEEDEPNFGLFSNESSWYSKCKHAFEVESRNLTFKNLRIRMPMSYPKDERSFLRKIYNYNNLINYDNSKTDVQDLCNVINILLNEKNWWEKGQDTYNVVNSNPLTTSEVCAIMEDYNFYNPYWKFVSIKEIPIKTGRSNCILDNSKLKKIYDIQTEKEALIKILSC